MATKTEDTTEKLLDVIERLSAKVEELESKVASPKLATVESGPKTLERSDRPGVGGGWLVRAGNPNYDGMTAGIQFVNGMAVVDVELEGVDIIIHRLEHDFNYQVTPLDERGVNETRKAMAMAGRRGPVKSMGEKLVRPG